MKRSNVMRDNDMVAFPTAARATDFRGMTLRDYFAAHAVLSMLDNGDYEGEQFAIRLASHAYQVADAMLAERIKDQPT